MFKKSLAILLSLLFVCGLVPVMAEEGSDEELKKSVETQLAELVKRNLVGQTAVEDFLKALNADMTVTEDGVLHLEIEALLSNPKAYEGKTMHIDAKVSVDVDLDGKFGYRLFTKEKDSSNYYGESILVFFPEKLSNYYWNGDVLGIDATFMGMQEIYTKPTPVFVHQTGTELRYTPTEEEKNASFEGDFPALHFLKYYHNAESYIGQGFTLTGTTGYIDTMSENPVVTLSLDTQINYSSPSVKVIVPKGTSISENQKVSMKVLAKGVLEEYGKLYAIFELAPDTSIDPAN